jgi:two-component system, LuxR family, response regulator FixJ
LAYGLSISEADVNARPLRIGVVDDDEAVRDSLAVLLQSFGMHVHAFSSPLSYLEGATGFTPDCLIFDLHMPQMTGLELAEKLRADRITTPVIILTGRTDPFLAARMERACVAFVLAKPIADADLVAAIRKAVERPCERTGCR